MTSPLKLISALAAALLVAANCPAWAAGLSVMPLPIQAFTKPAFGTPQSYERRRHRKQFSDSGLPLDPGAGWHDRIEAERDHRGLSGSLHHRGE